MATFADSNESVFCLEYNCKINVITGAEVIGVVVIAGVTGVPQCKFTNKGLEYKGSENRPRANVRCQEWESQTVSITKNIFTWLQVFVIVNITIT